MFAAAAISNLNESADTSCQSCFLQYPRTVFSSIDYFSRRTVSEAGHPELTLRWVDKARHLELSLPLRGKELIDSSTVIPYMIFFYTVRIIRISAQNIYNSIFFCPSKYVLAIATAQNFGRFNFFFAVITFYYFSEICFLVVKQHKTLIDLLFFVLGKHHVFCSKTTQNSARLAIFSELIKLLSLC